MAGCAAQSLGMCRLHPKASNFKKKGLVQELQLKIFHTQMENNSLSRHLQGQKTLYFYPSVCGGSGGEYLPV